jgi:hypothetical protein
MPETRREAQASAPAAPRRLRPRRRLAPATRICGRSRIRPLEKKSIEISYIDDADEYLAKIMAIVNAKTIDNEPAAQQLENGGLNDGLADHGQDDTIDIIEKTGLVWRISAILGCGGRGAVVPSPLNGRDGIRRAAPSIWLSVSQHGCNMDC